MVAGVVGGTPAFAGSAVHVNTPSVVPAPSQASMSAVQNVIRNIRDSEQRKLGQHTTRRPATSHRPRVR
jgi:hypothetical protein